MFVNGFKLEVFHEEIYYRAFEILVDVMAETRHELANYRDIIEIKRPEPRETRKIGVQMLKCPRNKGLTARLRLGCLS